MDGEANELRLNLSCRIKESNKRYLRVENIRTGLSVGQLVDLAIELLKNSPEHHPPEADNKY